MIINLSRQANFYPALTILPVRIYTGSAVPIEIDGIPKRMAIGIVTGFKVSLTNANGVTVTANCTQSGRRWYALFAASNFATYGFISQGAKFVATLAESEEEGASTHDVIIAIGDLDVVASSASVSPGDPSSAFQKKGDDEFVKSTLVDSVQHYKKVVIAYDEDMAAWGFNLEGDYILNSSGNFVPANS